MDGPGPVDSSKQSSKPPQPVTWTSSRHTPMDAATSARNPAGQTTSADPDAIQKRELTPWRQIARATAAIAEEAARLEIAAERAGEEAVLARLRHMRAKKAAEIADQAALSGEPFQQWVLSTQEACDRARDEEGAAIQAEKQAVAEWRQAMEKLSDAALFCAAEMDGNP